MLFAEVILIRHDPAGTILPSRPICLQGSPDSVLFLHYKSNYSATYIMSHLVLSTVFDASTLPAMDYSSLFSSGLRAMSLRKARPSSVIIENSPTRSSRPESVMYSPTHKRSESEKPSLHKRQTIHGSYNSRSYRERDASSRAPTLPSKFPVPSQRHSVISRPLPPVPHK